MINADELIDGSSISTILTDMAASLIAVLLSIMVAAFEMGLTFLENALDLTVLGSNPAIFIIGIVLVVTAFLIWRK